MDVVEVLRGTSAGPLLVAAGAVGAVAAVATVLAVTAWWTATRTASGHRPTTWLLAVAFATSTLELVLLLLDGAGPIDRWPALVLVRLVLLLGLAVLPRPARETSAGATEPPDAGPVGTRLLALGLSVALVAGSVLGAPTATGALPAGPGGLLTAATGVLLLTAVSVAVARGTAARGGRLALAGPLVLLLVVATPVAVLVAPDRLPPHQQVQLGVDGVALDLTVAPARPGTNELHLYALGPDGRPATVRDVTVEVVGAPASRHPLFRVSPDHHLSYVLDLPPSPPWTLRITLVGPDDVSREADWDLAPAG
ncbi:MAG: hypothetical protein ACNA8R_07480 [Nitriliruptoraceae bacterium]